MPVELIHKEILKKLGEFLGGFEGLEDNYLESSDINILANIEIGKSTFVPIKIITNHSIYEIKPEINANDFIPKTCFSSDYGSKITCIKAPKGEVLDIKFNPKGGFMLNRQNLGSVVSNNTLRLSECKGKETSLKDPVVEIRRRNPANEQILSPILIPTANKIINDLNTADVSKGPLILETTPSHQEALSAHIMNTLGENDSPSNLTLNLENRDKNKKKKEKKKKKNKKSKDRNKKRKNKKEKNQLTDESTIMKDDDNRRALEDKCILDYVGNSVTDDLMELFINEIADEEELALQKSLLARELCTPFSEVMITPPSGDAAIDVGDGLGIANTIEHCSPPDFATDHKKRGRKTMTELLSRAGCAAGQTKITNIFEAGKGKILPNEP
ncbi:hypothetical protein SUGI_0930700 [Cryptomeria japonica]|nr:hypothetical protein SUGI_0930700 [Cryptomeria japonica]